jgi:hypothetical protein
MSQNSGRLQVNLDTPNWHYDNLQPLNRVRVFGGFYATNVVAGGADNGTDWPGRLNADGLPTSMPTSGFWVSEGSCYGNPYNGSNAAQSDWDLELPPEYTGVLMSADGEVIWQDISGTVSLPPNTKRYRIAAGSKVHLNGFRAGFFAQIKITAISGPPTGYIRLYRANGKDKAQLDAGRHFTDEYEKMLGWPDNRVGCIRFMDWMYATLSRNRGPNHISPANVYSWRSNNANMRDASMWCGNTMTKSGNAYTTAARHPSNATSWSDALTLLSRTPAGLTMLNCEVTMGAVTTFRVPGGHGLVAGRRVQKTYDTYTYQTGQWNELRSRSGLGIVPDHPITIIDSERFSIPVNSTGWSMPTSGGVPRTTMMMLETPTISDGTLPPKRIVTQYGEAFTQNSTAMNAALRTFVYDSYIDAVFLMTPVHMIPPEAIAQTAERFECSPHVNMPCTANLSYVTTWCSRFKAATTFNDIKLRVEASNEPWNYFLQSYDYYQMLGAKLGYVNDDWLGGLAWQYDTIIKPGVVAGYSSRPGWVVACGQNVLYGNFLEGGSYGTTTAKKLGNLIDEIQVAPYFNFHFYGAADATTYGVGETMSYVQALQAYLDGDFETAYNWAKNEMINAPNKGSFPVSGETVDVTCNATNTWKINAALYTGRQGNGLVLGCYEGGQHVFETFQIANGFADYRGSGPPPNTSTFNNLTTGTTYVNTLNSDLYTKTAAGYSWSITGTQPIHISEQDIINWWFGFRQSAQYGQVMQYYLEKLVLDSGVTGYPSQFGVYQSWNRSGYTWPIVKAYDIYTDQINPAWTAMMNFNANGVIPADPIIITCT